MINEKSEEIIINISSIPKDYLNKICTDPGKRKRSEDEDEEDEKRKRRTNEERDIIKEEDYKEEQEKRFLEDREEKEKLMFNQPEDEYEYIPEEDPDIDTLKGRKRLKTFDPKQYSDTKRRKLDDYYDDTYSQRQQYLIYKSLDYQRKKEEQQHDKYMLSEDYKNINEYLRKLEEYRKKRQEEQEEESNIMHD